MDKSTNEEQEKLIDGFAEKFSSLELRNPPDTLYHYTSFEALKNIIANRNLWLTHALSMNDVSEFSHGMAKFKTAIDKLEKMGVEKDWLDRIWDFFDREMKDPVTSPYVFSMTQEPYQPNQWEKYGDCWRGISMGLGTKEIVEFQGLHFKFLPVIYDESKQDQIANLVIAGFVDLIKSMNSRLLDDGTYWGPKLALGYFQAAYCQSIRFKSNAWSQECEWRAIVLAAKNNPSVFSRPSTRGQIRYFPLAVPTLSRALVEIVVGPKAEWEKQKALLEAIRLENQFIFGIYQSKISL